MQTPLAAIVAAAVAVVTLAAETPAPAPISSSASIPRYDVKGGSSPPMIDGMLDDAAWAGASPAVSASRVSGALVGDATRRLRRRIHASPQIHGAQLLVAAQFQIAK